MYVLTLDSRCCLMTVALAWTTGGSLSSSLPLSFPSPLLSLFSSSSSLPVVSSSATDEGAAVERTLRLGSPPTRTAADSRTDSGELPVVVEDDEERAAPSREWRAPQDIVMVLFEAIAEEQGLEYVEP